MLSIVLHLYNRNDKEMVLADDVVKIVGLEEFNNISAHYNKLGYTLVSIEVLGEYEGE